MPSIDTIITVVILIIVIIIIVVVIVIIIIVIVIIIIIIIIINIVIILLVINDIFLFFCQWTVLQEPTAKAQLTYAKTVTLASIRTRKEKQNASHAQRTLQAL